MLEHVDGGNVLDVGKTGQKYLPYSPTAVGMFDFSQGANVTGPYGNQFHAINIFNTNNGEYVNAKTFSSNSKWAVGVAFSPRVNGHTDDLQQWAHVTWLVFKSGGNVQIAVGISDAGRLTVWRGGSGTNQSGSLIANPSTVLAVGSFYYIEVEVQFAVNGYVKIWVAPITGSNPTSTMVLNLPNTDTIPNSGTCDKIIRRWQNGQFAGVYWADYYICSGSGGINTGRLGPSRVFGLMPTADYQKVWTPLSGSDNFRMLYERHGPPQFPGSNQPDDDTTYVSGSGASAEDLFAIEAPTCTGLIHGVAANVDAKTLAVLQAVYRGNGAIQNIGSTLAFSDAASYKILQGVSEENPDNLEAWTDGDIAAGAWGFRGNSGGAARVTNFHLEKLVSCDPSTPFDCGGGRSYVY